ncbi:VOC family protein [Pseudonocardia sp. HH130629-09]|uniref:VOC family protein n=1 Tax=Pseudonocardia sp. HH130629-09 TaxID=1641402 RepID=UPI0006CB3A80|nr:VOC family protein [Pseudonocardia sp. HH130629-09]ALE86234.1 glyoxalase [Pseudonocardia sp. HH130629-09]
MAVERMYPRLVVHDADAAIDFYLAAFGAELVERYTDGSDAVVHALLRAGGAEWALKDGDAVDPAPSGPGAVIMALEVDAPDAVAAAMVAHGGRVLFPVTDHDYGRRAGRIADPFGHAWMVAAHTGDLTPERIQERTGRL